MAVKQKAGEDFSSEKIELVLSLLEKGETKKECCNVLGIKYNTARLGKIIDAYMEKEALQEKIKKSLRNKPLEKQDIIYICQEYLNGEALVAISDNTYRSTTVVKNVLKRYNIPLRNASNNYFNPIYIDEDESNDYVKGDLVYSARYNCLAEVITLVTPGIYRICILGKNQKYANQYSHDLADLRNVQKDLGITGIWEKDTRQRAWRAVVDAQKRKKEKNK